MFFRRRRSFVPILAFRLGASSDRSERVIILLTRRKLRRLWKFTIRLFIRVCIRPRAGRDLLLETDMTCSPTSSMRRASSIVGREKGLLRPEEMFEFVPTESPTRERTLQGLYMLEPYDPKKIPVVMTHGLGSSPTTWLEMYNALRNAPDIQNAYQFWFYFYPTGQPFWASAAQLRTELSRLRETVDPARSEPARSNCACRHSMGA